MTPDARTDGKAAFDHIYDQPDPREYFRTLLSLSYQIPAHAQPVFRSLLAAMTQARQAAAPYRPTVLDLCCSYGLNAALLRCDITLDDLHDRYLGAEVADLSSEQLIAADRTWFAERRRDNPPRTLGLDVAGRAVAYARAVGLLDGGWAENLESDEPSVDLVAGGSTVDLVTITGGVGYVTEPTFTRLLRFLPRDPPPWVAAFVLRTYDYVGIASTLAQHGLVTEQATAATVRQRRFADTDERDSALRTVQDRGLDTAGREDDGWYHCDFYLSRPGAEAGRPTVDELLAPA